MVDLNLLRIDLDKLSKKSAINFLRERLGYSHDINFLKVSKIKKIELIKKTKYGVKIYLNFNLKHYNNVILLESVLGDDYRKSMNAMINYHILKMKEYPNRLFSIKRYKDGTYKNAEVEDITDEIKNYVLNERRKKWNN